MKKVKYFIYAILIFGIFSGSVSAASLSVSASTKSAVVGNTISITVSASGAAGWEYCLNYDSSVFSFVSSNSDKGGTCLQTGSTLIGYSKVTFKFKAIKSGSSNFSLRNAVMYGDDGNAISSNKGNVTVTARTQAEIQASYSDNANLKALGVEGFEITPGFSQAELEYSLEVENNVTSVNIYATKAQANASVNGAGYKELSEGINKFEIVVTAQKGNKKTYVININRKELDPIHVTVGDKKMTVVRKADALTAPTYYEATTTIIDGTEVPALKSEITGYTLVGLKDEEGLIDLYRYEDKDNRFSVYKQLSTEVINFVPLETKDKIDGFDKTKTIKINNEDVDVYYNSDMKDVYLIYGLNMNTDKEGWYSYEKTENTFQIYNDNGIAKLKKDNELYVIILIVLGSCFGLTIIALLISVINNSKLKKKNAKMLTMLEELNNKVKGKKSDNKKTDSKKEE